MDKLVYKLWFQDLFLKRWEKISLFNSNIEPEVFYNFTLKDYINLGFDLIQSERIVQSKKLGEYEKIYEYLLEEKIKFILYTDKNYPEQLRKIPDPPTGIFVRGELPQEENLLSVVGARKSSEYGKSVAYKFSYELSSLGIVIVSGMARGIDTCAHKGALDGKGKTVAVLGSGFKNIYPKENKELFNNISQNGCVITEYFPDAMPLPQNFPERNRIISGLSKYVLVVEASEKSGSLITAGLALEQGKDVFAVPGNIFSPNSKGCNQLIRDGAKIITGLEDIFEEFNIIKNCSQVLNCSDDEKTIINLLKAGGINMEVILENSNLNANKILATLSKLECKGIIKKTYGNYYILC